MKMHKGWYFFVVSTFASTICATDVGLHRLIGNIARNEFAECIMQDKMLSKHDLGKIEVETWPQCQINCKETNECAAFSFVDKECRLSSKRAILYSERKDAVYGPPMCKEGCKSDGIAVGVQYRMVVNKSILNYDSCALACMDAQPCVAATFDYVSDMCYLFSSFTKIGMKAGAFTFVKRCDDPGISVHRDVTLAGAPNTKITAPDLHACRESCRMKPESCVFFTYNQDTKDCYLASTGALGSWKVQVGAFSGVPWAWGANCVIMDADAPFKDIDVVSVLTVQNCQAKCVESEKCLIFTFVVANSQCHLKGSEKTAEHTFLSKNGYITGPKRCSNSNWCDENDYAYHYADLRTNHHFKEATSLECKNRCRKEEGCEMWSWYMGYCYVKYLDALKNREYTKRHDSGHPICGTADYCIEDKSFYGGSRHLVDVPNIDSARQCQTNCQKISQCQFFSFKKGKSRADNFCRLYPKTVTRQRIEGFSGGPAVCV